MIVRLIVQTFIWFCAMGILLFMAAGTFAWPGNRQLGDANRDALAPRLGLIQPPR